MVIHQMPKLVEIDLTEVTQRATKIRQHFEKAYAHVKPPTKGIICANIGKQFHMNLNILFWWSVS